MGPDFHVLCDLTFAFPNLTELQLGIHHTFVRYANGLHKYRLLELGWAGWEFGRINYAYYVIVEINMWSHNRNNQKSVPVLQPVLQPDDDFHVLCSFNVIYVKKYLNEELCKMDESNKND